MVDKPRDSFAERLVRQSEPYHWQRNRQRLNAQPRPSQPNTNQPNQINRIVGWGQGDYWGEVFKAYLKRRQTGSSITNLALGGLR